MSEPAKKIVLSGLRPTGRVHLGNYWGAVKNWVDLQDQYDCRYFVADLHALFYHRRPEPAQVAALLRPALPQPT